MENSATEIVTPAAEHVMLVRDRTIIAAWNVRQADGDGWRPQAVLEVKHWKKARCYQAVLRAALARDEDSMKKFTYQMLLDYVVVLQQDASRFNRNTLNALYERALMLLRRRFDDGDDAVRAYFDPTSDQHTA